MQKGMGKDQREQMGGGGGEGRMELKAGVCAGWGTDCRAQAWKGLGETTAEVLLWAGGSGEYFQYL